MQAKKMNRIQHIENEISGLRTQLQNHKLYESLKNVDDIKKNKLLQYQNTFLKVFFFYLSFSC